MNTRVILIAVAGLLGGAIAANAHDTWLIPTNRQAAVGKPIELRLTSGMAFAADDFVIDGLRITRASVRLGGSTADIAGRAPHAKALHLTWTPTKPGIATFGVSLQPKDLSLTPALVEEYFADINAIASVRERYAAMKAPRKWRERYTKHATSYVCVAGATSPDSSWTKAINLNLEIVPEKDPTSLRAGDALPVRAFYRGAPLAGFMIGAQHDAETAVKFVQTDATGRATVALPRAGWWLINGTHLRPSTDASREWDSDFATITISVAAAGTKPGC